MGVIWLYLGSIHFMLSIALILRVLSSIIQRIIFFRCWELNPGFLSGKRERSLCAIQPLLLPRGLLTFLLGGEEHRFRSHRHRNIVTSGHWSNNNWKLTNAENWLNYVRHNTSLILKRPFRNKNRDSFDFFQFYFRFVSSGSILLPKEDDFKCKHFKAAVWGKKWRLRSALLQQR